MDKINKTISKIQNDAALVCKGGRKSALDDIVNYFSLLSAPPNRTSVEKLCSVLRDSFCTLYNACQDQALRLAFDTFSFLSARLFDSIDGPNPKRTECYTTMIKALFSGLLDFVEASSDQEGSKEKKKAVASFFYPELCKLFFVNNNEPPPKMALSTDADLRYTVYMLIFETLVGSATNQHQLRASLCLGGERLGATISKTHDFVVSEALLLIASQLIPPPTKSDPEKRSRFIKDIVNAPGGQFECANELIQILDDAHRRSWDDVSLRISSTLASSDIAFPQPFQVPNFTVGGNVYPQNSSKDRLYADKTSFCANVELVEDIETFRAHYSTILRVELTPASRGTTKVAVLLSKAPMIGMNPIRVTTENPISLEFRLETKDVRRFEKSLRHRGIREVVLKEKISNCIPVNISFDPADVSKSLFERTEEVTAKIDQLRENSADPELGDVVKVADPTTSDKHATEEHANEKHVTAANPNLTTRSTPLTPEQQKLSDSIFGTSSENLSELSDDLLESKAEKLKRHRGSSRIAKTNLALKPKPFTSRNRTKPKLLSTKSVSGRDSSEEEFESPSPLKAKTPKPVVNKRVPVAARKVMSPALSALSVVEVDAPPAQPRNAPAVPPRRSVVPKGFTLTIVSADEVVSGPTEPNNSKVLQDPPSRVVKLKETKAKATQKRKLDRSAELEDENESTSAKRSRTITPAMKASNTTTNSAIPKTPEIRSKRVTRALNQLKLKTSPEVEVVEADSNPVVKISRKKNDKRKSNKFAALKVEKQKLADSKASSSILRDTEARQIAPDSQLDEKIGANSHRTFKGSEIETVINAAAQKEVLSQKGEDHSHDEMASDTPSMKAADRVLGVNETVSKDFWVPIKRNDFGPTLISPPLLEPRAPETIEEEKRINGRQKISALSNSAKEGQNASHNAEQEEDDTLGEGDDRFIKISKLEKLRFPNQLDKDKDIAAKTPKMPVKNLVDRQNKASRSLSTVSDDQPRDVYDVLREITETVVQRLKDRVGGVKANVRQARQDILQEAADEIREMNKEIFVHYNDLIDVEASYAKARKNLINCWEDVVKTSDNLVRHVGETIKEHDKNSIVNYFPKALPSLPLGALSKLSSL